jgi:hypothetical protein
MGNVKNENGSINPKADWSYSSICEIFYEVVASVPNPPNTFDIQGHSAGGHVTHRMAFLMPEAPLGSIVVANPGLYLLPTYDEAYPKGIADMNISTDDLATAFAQDLTITLGILDNDPGAPLLSHTEWAEAQGPHRLARGHYFYDYCKNLAANLSLPFHWKLVEVKGVGHSGNAMAPSAVEAIFGNHFINLTALDDSYIKENHDNYGADLEMKVDADFGMTAFLKFDLTSLADVQIKFAALRLNVTDSSSGIQSVHYVPDNSWSEDTLTNDTKPSSAQQVSTGYGGIENVTTVIRLTEFIRLHKGNVVSLCIKTNSSDGFYFSSKEANHAPEILIWEVEEPPTESTITLHPGWNLISLPYVQLNSDIESIFSSISGSYDVIQYFDAQNSEDPWKHYHIDKPNHMNDLNEVQNTMGIWIHITDSEDVLFEIPGAQATQVQTVSLTPGWNLVGYPSISNVNRTDGLNNTLFGPHIDKIMWYNATSGKWHDMGENDYFQQGKGYWIHSKVEASWKVPL